MSKTNKKYIGSKSDVAAFKKAINAQKRFFKKLEKLGISYSETASTVPKRITAGSARRANKELGKLQEKYGKQIANVTGRSYTTTQGKKRQYFPENKAEIKQQKLKDKYDKVFTEFNAKVDDLKKRGFTLTDDVVPPADKKNPTQADINNLKKLLNQLDNIAYKQNEDGNYITPAMENNPSKIEDILEDHQKEVKQEQREKQLDEGEYTIDDMLNELENEVGELPKSNNENKNIPSSDTSKTGERNFINWITDRIDSILPESVGYFDSTTRSWKVEESDRIRETLNAIWNDVLQYAIDNDLVDWLERYLSENEDAILAAQEDIAHDSQDEELLHDLTGFAQLICPFYTLTPGALEGLADAVMGYDEFY